MTRERTEPAEPSPPPVGDPPTPTPLWLSHHPPAAYDRCVRVGPLHLCRRCLVLYPVAVAALVVVALLGPSPADPWLLLLLPLPAVVEWWREQLGRTTTSPARLVAVTVPAGIALGVGLARYLADPLDPVFWAMVVGYGGSCAAVALWRFLDEHAP